MCEKDTALGSPQYGGADGFSQIVHLSDSGFPELVLQLLPSPSRINRRNVLYTQHCKLSSDKGTQAHSRLIPKWADYFSKSVTDNYAMLWGTQLWTAVKQHGLKT